MLRERRFRAMGSDVHLVVHVEGDAADTTELVRADAALDAAEVRLADLEQQWSRFLPASELSALNARTGRVHHVGADTALVVALAVEGWERTGGRFDPTVHDAVVAAGYDRSFELLAAGPRNGDDTPAPPAVTAEPAHGAGDVLVDLAARTILLPRGVHLDLGGIGKGHAADLAAGLLLDAGMSGACVNVGGDVRLAGRGPDDGRWAVAVEDPFDPSADLAVLVLDDGAVATSARTRRSWRGASGPAHHLIDPTTGRPASTGLAAVSVVAGTAAWAEVFAKAAFLAGADDALGVLEDAGLDGLVVDDGGNVARTAGLAAFEPTAAASAGHGSAAPPTKEHW